MAAMYMTETDHQVASMVHCGVTATQDGKLQRLRAPGLCARLLLCLSASLLLCWLVVRLDLSKVELEIQNRASRPLHRVQLLPLLCWCFSVNPADVGIWFTMFRVSSVFFLLPA